MKRLVYSELKGLCLKFVSMGIVVTSSSCFEFQPNWDVADYGYSLPNYCEKNEDSLYVLETDSRNYGQFLAKRGYLGEWDGLLPALMPHRFIWGDSETAVKIGSVYAERRSEAGLVELEVARFLVDADETTGGDGGFDKTPFSEAFGWSALEIKGSVILAFEDIDNSSAFREWVGYSNGLDAMLVLAARLHVSEADDFLRGAIIEKLKPVYTEEISLNRFTSYANSTAQWSWHRWLQISIMLERYANRSGDVELVRQLRAGRLHIAKQMEGTDFEQGWVSCILGERGVFEAK